MIVRSNGRPEMECTPTTTLGPFEVADRSRVELISDLLQSNQKRAALALHIGGLNLRKDRGFIEAMKSADFVYADGAAVVLLARLAGAKNIQRSPTTDLGHALFAVLAQRTGSSFAIVGGPPGLAQRAAIALKAEYGVPCGLVADGFRADYTDTLRELRVLQPEILVVGMGMPREALWVHQHWDALPNSLILTCGGWLGFLAGEERRAPLWLQRYGLEWVFRLCHHPARLLERYLRGMLTVIAMSAALIRKRRCNDRE